MTKPDYTWIRDERTMSAAAEQISKAKIVAFDTESNSSFVYREQVCLIQINADEHYYLIDPLETEDAQALLEPLRECLENEDQICLLHGGEYDVICMRRDFDITLRGVFDTQQAASFLGYARSGYGSVVQELLDIELPKAYSQYNWGQRPIEEGPLEYAIDDVVYLPRIAEKLQEQIVEAGLEEECAIAMQTVMDATGRDPGYDPAGIYRIKGVGKLPDSALPIVHEIYEWRDVIAEAANVPPGRMINNEAMLMLARQRPRNWGLLKRCRLRSAFMREYGDDLIEVIKRGMDKPRPLPERPVKRDYDPTAEDREKRLKKWRQKEAENREVPLQVVLPARALDFIKHNGAEDLSIVPQLGEKRAELYGDKLRDLCETE